MFAGQNVGVKQDPEPVLRRPERPLLLHPRLWQAYFRVPATPHSRVRETAPELNINAHLDCGSRDVDMLRHWDSKLLPAVSRFRPDFIIVSAGFDSRQDDLLGCF